LVKVLERKGILTRQEIYDAINERRRYHEGTTLDGPQRGKVRLHPGRQSKKYIKA